ncbi:hypothetical protein EON65_50680 [archaeon]|nr:MAG: hypothetical protein EON65_50680 [archaeon]
MLLTPSCRIFHRSDWMNERGLNDGKLTTKSSSRRTRSRIEGFSLWYLGLVIESVWSSRHVYCIDLFIGLVGIAI